MNNSYNDTLEDLNAVMFDFNKPVVIFIAFFMLLGIVGNSLVLFIYSFRMKISTLKIFILYLGCIDMVGCFLAVPLEMVDLILPLIYPCDPLCKVQHLTIYYNCIASVLSLFVIAVDRFNCMCRPLTRQMSTVLAKWIVVGITLISLLFVLPVSMSFHRGSKQGENNIMTYQCLHNLQGPWKSYYFFLFSLFLILLFIIFVLYFFIWKKARLYFRQREARRHMQTKDESIYKANHNSSAVNMTIFSITALLAIIFIPNFIINLAQPKYTKKSKAFIKILHRLWVMNCSLNPFIYGICNSEFRYEFKRLLTIKLKLKFCYHIAESNDIEI